MVFIFINDLPNCSCSGHFRIFTDDTNVFFYVNSVDELISIGKIIMTALNSWFTANKMTLNTTKSTFTIFKSSRKMIPNLPEEIKFLDYEIKRTQHIKFLDITLDENLSWNLHIDEVCRKLKSFFHIFFTILGNTSPKKKFNQIIMLLFTL